MAVQWFDSFKDFMAMLQTPEYAAKMQPDEDRILDLPKMVVLITEEAEVFIGDVTSAGRVALVTGGASGIGAAVRRPAAGRAGATVVAADLTAGDGVVALDVTDEAAVDALVAPIVAEHGRLDLAANVAGTSGVYGDIAD